jgi:5'-nucleotidase (lipoprotein e(P4) family)
MIAVSVAAALTVSAQAPLTDRLYMSVLWYRTSAEATALYDQCYDHAILKAEKNLLARKAARPAAVILDIDETVLDNSQFEVERIAEGKGYSSAKWQAWTSRSEAGALPGALRFTRWADSLGVSIFYISNRKVEEQDQTISNLKAHGFPQANEEHLLLKEKSDDKTDRRAKVARDHDVILLVGDNLTDYSEAFAKRGAGMGKDSVEKYLPELRSRFIMLPNPMYGEWEKTVYGNTYALPDSTKAAKQSKALGIPVKK